METDQTLQALVGSTLRTGGRAADMQAFTFITPDRREFVLHLQCPWRIVTDHRVVVGFSDFWRQAAADTPKSAYDNALGGSRWRDLQEAEFFRQFAERDRVVQRASADAFGGFTLVFGGAFRLEIFVDATPASHDEMEFWRLFENHGAHAVVSTNGFARSS